MDADQINCYRVNYEVTFWQKVAEDSGNFCSSPFGAVLAVNALCDEVELMHQQIADLRSAIKNLIDVKGRFHTEQAYNRLVETFDRSEPNLK